MRPPWEDSPGPGGHLQMQVTPGTGEELKGSVGSGEICVAREAGRLHGDCGGTGLFAGRAHKDGHSDQRRIPCRGRDRGKKAAQVGTGTGFHATGARRVDGDDWGEKWLRDHTGPNALQKVLAFPVSQHFLLCGLRSTHFRLNLQLLQKCRSGSDSHTQRIKISGDAQEGAF